MLELRKEYFADERDDNLKEIGKGTQRQDMLGHVTGASTYFNDHKLQGMLHLKVLRSAHSHARLRRIDLSEAERSPGVRRIIRGQDVPRNLNTLLSLINFGIDDEPTLAVDKVRYKGEPIVAVVADTPREAYEAMAKIRVDYEPLPTVFDVEEALKPGAPVVNETYPKNTFTYHERYDHQKLQVRRRRARLRRGRSRHRASLSDVADRARADRDQWLDRRARHQWPLHRLHLDAGVVLLARHLREDPRRALQHVSFRRRHGRRRLRRQGRHADRAALHSRRHADGKAGALRVRARRGDAIRPAARRRTHLSEGRRQARRPHRRAQGARLFRLRRLYAAFELRRRQMRRASARALYDPERLRRRLLRLHQPDAGDRDARLRRDRRWTSPSNVRWIGWRSSSAWTRWSSASSTPIATAT